MNVKEQTIADSILNAVKLTPGEKIQRSLELSNFCSKLQSAIVKAGKYGGFRKGIKKVLK